MDQWEQETNLWYTVRYQLAHSSRQYSAYNGDNIQAAIEELQQSKNKPAVDTVTMSTEVVVTYRRVQK